MPSEVYIARQLVIDDQQRIVGYELLYRNAASATQANFDDEAVAGAEVLSNLLTHLGFEPVLGENLAFLNVSAAMLDSELLDLLPSSRVVLEILDASPDPALLEQCQALRDRGFRIALNNVLPTTAEAPLLAVADYVKLDIQCLDMPALKAATQALRAYPVKIIAQKVETPTEYRNCRTLGLDGFQGFHFAHPETLTARAINPSLLRVTELLNLIRRNADFGEIEKALKHDVALSIRLLRYINSVGSMLSQPIRSVRHALTVLGYRQLYRWLSLLLLTSDEKSRNPALARTALVRGRLTELLGTERLEGHERDNLFIVGLFSLIDVILGIPIAKAIDTLSLPEGISEALLNRGGVYGPFLGLAKACEGGDWKQIDQLAQKAGLSARQINEAHLGAIAWAEQIFL